MTTNYGWNVQTMINCHGEDYEIEFDATDIETEAEDFGDTEYWGSHQHVKSCPSVVSYVIQDLSAKLDGEPVEDPDTLKLLEDTIYGDDFVWDLLNDMLEKERER